MIWKPDVTVAAVVEREGRFLVVEERVRSRLVINQPAGHLEKGESLVQAVIREALEETAWHFVPQTIVGIYLWNQAARSAEGPARTFLRVAFNGTVTHQEGGRTLDTGIERTLWLSREQLAAQPARLRSPLVLRCVDDYLAGHRFPLEVLTHLAADAGFAADLSQSIQTG
jgi:8-oxo-dGTP pyrophosphatase MutT (NUDIX family)